MILDT